MTRNVDQTALFRNEIEWKVYPVAGPDDDLCDVTEADAFNLVRRLTSYPVTKANAVQWSRGESTEFDPIRIPVTEVASVIQELVEWMSYAMADAKKALHTT